MRARLSSKPSWNEWNWMDTHSAETTFDQLMCQSAGPGSQKTIGGLKPHDLRAGNNRPDLGMMEACQKCCAWARPNIFVVNGQKSEVGRLHSQFLTPKCSHGYKICSTRHLCNIWEILHNMDTQHAKYAETLCEHCLLSCIFYICGKICRHFILF
jgi:hypothetical protein